VQNGHARGSQFLVVQGVADLYDVLLSTHVARDWGARADPVLNELQYRPHLLTNNDRHTIASVPLSTTGKSPVGITSATAFVCCVTAHKGGGEADVIASHNATLTPNVTSMRVISQMPANLTTVPQQAKRKGRIKHALLQHARQGCVATKCLSRLSCKLAT